MSLRIPPPPSAGADGLVDGAPLGEASGPPAGLGASGGFFTEAEAEPKTRLSGPMLLVIVVALAGGVLLAMRQLGLGPRLSMLEVKIDYPLDGETKANKNHKAILNDLKSSGIEQVPLEKVQMNPFEWKSLAAQEPVVAGPKEEDPAEVARRALEARRVYVKDSLSRLQLNSVLAGRVPVARISGELVKVGDVLGGVFTVKTITGRAVELEADGERFTLALGESAK